MPVSSPKLCQVPSLSRYALFILNVESVIRNHKSKSICFGFAGICLPAFVFSLMSGTGCSRSAAGD